MKYGRLSALNRKLRFKKRKFVNFKKSYKMWRRIATLFRNRYQFSRNNYRFSSKPRNKFLVDYTKPKNYEKLKARVKRRTFNSQRIINFRKFRKFYSTLTVQQFKRLVSFVNFSSKRGSLVNNFITFIESRLDVMLFRSGLVTSLFMSKHFIIHKHILVNNAVSCFPNRNLNLLDLISFNTLSFNSVLQNVKLNYVKRWLNYIKSGKKKRQKRKVNLMLLNLPSYIEVDFKAFSFILIADIFRKNVFYPFKISNQELSVFLNRIKTKVN
jgi:ribosomal protein S4